MSEGFTNDEAKEREREGKTDTKMHRETHRDRKTERESPREQAVAIGHLLLPHSAIKICK